MSIDYKDFSLGNGIFENVMKIGIPASLGSLMMSFSQIIANSLMSSYGDASVAMKVTMLTGMMCIVFSNGVQPLIGYAYGASLVDRFKSIMATSTLFSFILSFALTLLCYIFTPQIVFAFLTEEIAYTYALDFSRILLSTSFLFGIFYVLTTALQAIGEAFKALIVNLSRQGIIYIPALFIMNKAIGINGLLWAQPVADVLSTLIMALLFIMSFRKLRKMA